MQIVITASGSEGDNFLQAGFTLPKNLVHYRGKTILDYVIEQYRNFNFPITVTLQRSECSEFKTDKILQGNHPGVRIVQIPEGNHGALCSALLGIDSSLSDGLLIVPGDSVTRGFSSESMKMFIGQDTDAGTLVFKSDSPRWSYVRTDNHDRVLEIAEKRVISSFATTGLFYFRTVDTFIEGANWALVNATNLNGRYYVSHSLHKLLSMQKTVIAQRISKSESYFNFSTPADLAQRLEDNEN